jgi:hypothetical protein
MPARGPLRMICDACWQPMERTSAPAIYAGKDALLCWDHVIAFEQQCIGAIKGRTPDQFRFNFTSADQLLNEVRGICRLPDQEAAKRRILVVQDTEHPAERFRVRRDDARLHGPPILFERHSQPARRRIAAPAPAPAAAACGIIETNPEIGAALLVLTHRQRSNGSLPEQIVACSIAC